MGITANALQHLTKRLRRRLLSQLNPSLADSYRRASGGNPPIVRMKVASLGFNN
jgi:hypothetical protein